MTWDDNVFRFPQQDTEGITLEQARSILLMSRVSTERLLGVYGQAGELQAWAESRGFSVIEHVMEICSGRLPIEERPGMAAALERVRRRDTEMLAWTTFARLARSVEQTRRIFHTCWDADVRTYILSDDGQPFGEVCPTHPEDFWVPAALRAEDEGKLIQDRMTAGKRRKAARGQWPLAGCAPPPFEMDRIQIRDQFTGELRTVHRPNRERWVLKEQMVAMHDAGMGYKRIARALNEQGIRHRHGVEWTRDSVRAVIRKPFPLRHDVVRGDLYERPGTPLRHAQQSREQRTA